MALYFEVIEIRAILDAGQTRETGGDVIANLAYFAIR